MHAVGDTLDVAWTSDRALGSGEFSVWARSRAGTLYLGDVVPAAGGTSFTHGLVPPQTLTYGGPTSWTMGATAFKYPVLLDQNANQSITMAAGSATQGASTTLTASCASVLVYSLFNPVCFEAWAVLAFMLGSAA